MFPAARTVHDLAGPNSLETEVKCERPDEMILLAKRFRVVNEFFLHTQNALQIFWELKWILVSINSLENFLADALTVDMKLQLKLVKGSAASLNYVAAADDYESYSKWFQTTS